MFVERLNCIFVHNRKCAGTSIGFALGVEPATPAWNLFNEGALDPNWTKRADLVQRAFKFSCVRNPFDRAVSGWRYLPALSGRSLGASLEDPPRDGHDYRHFTRTQSAILVDPSSAETVVDVLMRYETLQEDFDAVCDRIGAPRTQLPWRRRMERERDYRAYYDDRSRYLAEKLFEEDIARFGYTF